MNKPTQTAYSELQTAYDFFNQKLFQNELPDCLISFQRKNKSFGYFSHNRYINGSNKTTDEIALNPEFFLGYPLIEIFQTLVHEMCHLWQYRFGKPSRKAYHNKEWANKMISVGLMPSNTGEQGGNKTGQSMADYPIANGIFVQAALDLLKSGFTISWFDRFPVSKAKKEPKEWESALLENTESDTDLELVLKLTSKPIVEGAVFNEEQGNDSSKKNKYTCPSCKCSVWGKKNLNIICGDCKIKYNKID